MPNRLKFESDGFGVCPICFTIRAHCFNIRANLVRMNPKADWTDAEPIELKFESNGRRT